MYASHAPNQISMIQHTLRRVGTRLLPTTEPLAATWRRVDGVLPFATGSQGAFQPIVEGAVWGEGRENAWFHLTGTIPKSWAGRTVVAWVDLNTEALVYTGDGHVLQGINTGSTWDDTQWRNSRPFVHLHDACRGGEAVELWIDAACWAHPGAMDLSGPTAGELTVAGLPLGQVKRLRLAVFDTTAWELFCDLEILLDLVLALPESSARRAPAGQLPVRLESEAVTIEALKRAEDGAGWILRLCNRSGLPASASLTATKPRRLSPCDGLEDISEEGLPAQNSWKLPLAPFAVRTWRILD